MTITVAGVRIPASNSDGRYPVKYGRKPSRPRVTTTAASSRRAASSRGGSAVTARQHLRAEFADHRAGAALREPALQPHEPRCERSTAPTGSAIGTASGRTLREAGSVITPATRCGEHHRRRDGARRDEHTAPPCGDQVPPHGRRARHSRGSIGPRQFIGQGARLDRPDRGRGSVGGDALAGTPSTSTPGRRAPAAVRSAPPTS